MPTPGAALKSGDLALIGLGTDENSSHMRGPATAPPAIRAALFSGASNLTTEAGLDLTDHPRFVDLDALDPAFAPGVSHHEPGGLTVRAALGIIQRLEVPLIGADIVEYNPRRDVQAMTATVAAKLLKEIGGKILERN